MARENPKAYDFDQVDAGGQVRGKGFKAIYQSTGEADDVVRAPEGRSRPRAFESKPWHRNRLDRARASQEITPYHYWRHR